MEVLERLKAPYIFPIKEEIYAAQLAELERRRMIRRSDTARINGGIPEYIYKKVYINEVCRATGYSPSGLSRIFNGTRNPQWGTACEIVDYIRTRYPKFTLDDLRDIIRARKEIRAKEADQAQAEEESNRFLVGTAV